jgi:aminoglycoside phosphotransferase (APT) family kinase protein
MRVLNVARLMDEIFTTEAELCGPIQAIDFIHRNRADVYRILAGGRRFIAYVTPRGTEYLEGLRSNLATVAVLADPRVPREVAWRKSSGAWAALICEEIPGDELNTANATPAALADLADLLLRLHSSESPGQPTGVLDGSVSEPSAFAAFAETLTRRLADLPIRPERVRQHLGAMAVFIHDHAEAFRVPTRLIHGDLHRSNIVSTGTSIGLLDWGDLSGGDYAFDLATLKFVLDAVKPRSSSQFIRGRARLYRERFQDASLETRLRFYLALPGLVRAFHCADDTAAFGPGRAWRVRACYLHSEAQWRKPLQLEGKDFGAPAVKTEDWALDLRQPFRGLFYLVAPRRVS